jgi:hypothetical protein
LIVDAAGKGVLDRDTPRRAPKEAKMKLQGRCYCGAVSYAAEGEVRMKAQCHCRECQYISGGSPNVLIAMPADGFSYAGIEPKSYARTDIPSPVRRDFCGTCGTHLAAYSAGMGLMFIKVGTLDDPSVFGMPQAAIFTCDAQSFHQIPSGVPAFERLPG